MMPTSSTDTTSEPAAEPAAEVKTPKARTLSARPRLKAAVAPEAEAAAEAAPAPAPKPAKSAAAAPAPAPSAKGGQNLQDQFLNHLRKNKTPVTMFLVKGVKLQGIVTWFDNFSILLRRDGQSQLVYKHAVSTIMPSTPIDTRLFGTTEGNKKARLLQDVFLSSIRAAAVQVTMFLVNGVMLQGRVAAYDLFCMMLEREGYVQLAYKHAVSTIQPVTPVDLTGEWDGEEDSDA
jgi:host factor-I protein